MKYSSWEQLGDELKSSIWEAVETGNFSSLSQTVAGTIDQAIDSIAGIGGSQNAGNTGGTGTSGYSYGGDGSTNWQYGDSDHAGTQETSAGSYNYGNSDGRQTSGYQYENGNSEDRQASNHQYGNGNSDDRQASGYQYGNGNTDSTGKSSSDYQYGYSSEGSGQGSSGYQYGNSSGGGQSSSDYQYGYGSSGGSHNAYTGFNASSGSRSSQPSKKIFKSGLGARVGGAIMAWGGGGMTAIYLLGLLSSLLDPWATAGEFISLAVFAALFGAVSVAGFRKLGLVKRFRRYVCLLEGHDYYDIQKLADQSCRSVKEVRKDLKTMIIRGWFRQGYMDKNGTCLMLTEQAHDQYQALMDRTRRQKEEEAEQERLRERAKEREAEERARKEAAQAKTEEERRQKEEELRRKEEEQRKKDEERYANLPAEVREIIRTGNDYIVKVHKLNDEIPGEEVTAKISRMELLLDRIFDRVEHHPESAGDVRRLMDYYLPMTVKLLEAYRDMDAQPIQLSNIASSKQEIEKTLDTLNSAFEKLLDDLFTATAWDLSSDISVLNTLLAQDGLAGRDIKQKQTQQ